MDEKKKASEEREKLEAVVERMVAAKLAGLKAELATDRAEV
jgi:hypothetical protein